MNLNRRHMVLGSLATLASCGAATPPPAKPGVLFKPQFEDAKPIAFSAPHPSSFAVHGIDAARFQKSIDWKQARQNGVNFAFIKATEGGDRLDPSFDDHWRGARRAGVERGAYHFYYFCTPPEVQATWFIQNVRRNPGMMPPVLDLEWNPLSPTCRLRPPATEVRGQAKRFLQIVTTHYGQKPIIYTTPKFYEENQLGRLTGYEFWLRSTAKTPAQAYPGQNWRFWQYSATGRIPGITGNVDLNAFNGSRADWAAWLANRRIG